MKKPSIVLFIVAFTLALFAVSLPSTYAATSYYVATNGNDSNPGTLDRPWLTLQKAARTANPGDKVLVRSGVYYVGGLSLSKVGTASAPIVFQSYTGERAILDGSRSAVNTTLMTISGQYYEIRGFEIRNAKRTAVSVWGGKYVRVSDNIIHDSVRGAVYGGNGASHISFVNNIVYNNVRENDQYEFKHNGGWAAAIITSESNDVILNNQVYENWGEGIGAYGRNHYVAGNVLHDNYSVELYVNNVSNSTFENNFVYTLNKTAFLRNFSGVWAAATGISIANENATVILNNNKVLNNIVVGKRMWGLSQWGGEASVPTGLQNTVIANNTVIGHGVNGLLKIENNAHSSSTIANNIFHQLNTAKPVAQIATNTGITFRNNTWFGGSSGVPAKGVGTGDRNINPQVVNAAGTTANDFRLKTSSPLINTGTTIASVTRDYFGTTRTGSYDIGAHETNGTTAAALELPAAPVVKVNLVAPVNGTNFTDPNSIVLQWQPVEGIINYRLSIKNRTGETVYTTKTTCATAPCSFSDPSWKMPSGERLKWRVVAIDANGNRFNSQRGRFFTDFLPATIVLNDVAAGTRMTAGSITLSWSHDPRVQQYSLVVVDAKGVKIVNQWDDAALLCAATNTCAKTVELPKGRYRWYVEGRSTNVTGKVRSEKLRFRVRANQ